MKITNDDIRDTAIKVVDKLVAMGLIKDCTDSDDETEFEVQDTIHQQVCEMLGIDPELENVVEVKKVSE